MCVCVCVVVCVRSNKDKPNDSLHIVNCPVYTALFTWRFWPRVFIDLFIYFFGSVCLFDCACIVFFVLFCFFRWSPLVLPQIL